ncbi:MAG: response regulator, partial [Betaproteobacteria bacterium]|nr:response regulator [Betaproteobacteria bacterium]
RPGVIFMDVTLPDGDGLALTRRLREGGITAVIVVTTSHDPSDYRDLAMRSGADHFIGKGSMDLISRIFDLVESLVASRFKALIVTDDAVFNDQMNAFLSQIRPGSVVVDTTDWNVALEIGDRLKPNLLVLDS